MNQHASLALRGFAVLAAAYIVSQFFRVSNAVIAPELMRTLSIGPEAMGAITGVFFLTFAVMQIPSGIALDRFGPRRTMSSLLALAALGAAVFALAEDEQGLLAGRALIGIGCAAGLMGSMVIISRWFAPERFAAMSSWLFIIGGTGTLFATTPLAALSDSLGWRGAFWLMTGATLLMAGLIFWLVQDRPPGQRPQSETETVREIAQGMRTVLSNRDLWHISALQFVNYASVLTISGLWGGPFLADVYGLDAIDRGNVLLAMNVATLLGVLAYSAVEKWVGSRKRTVVGGMLVSTAILVVLAAWPALPLSFAIGAMVGFAFTNPVVMLLHAHARAVLPDHLVGRGLTLENLAAFLGIATLQAATGFVLAYFPAESGTASAQGYAAVFWFLVGAAVVALLAYLPVRESREAD